MSAVTLQDLYDAICAVTQGEMPQLKSAQPWPEIGRYIPTPCMLLECVGFRPGDDPGTGETALVGTFQARFVVDGLDGKSELQASLLAARFAQVLRYQSWGLPVCNAEFGTAAPDWMRPELEEFTVWMVEWRQEFHVGDIEWPWDDSSSTALYVGIVPGADVDADGRPLAPEEIDPAAIGSGLFLGIDPETGRAHEDRYVPAGAVASARTEEQ